MKKDLFFIVVSILFSLSLNAQDIRGQVLNERGEALAYANVVLLTKSDSTFISGVVTADDGHFALLKATDSSLDECLLKISSIGYKNKYMSPRVDMGNITLIENVHELNEVVVSGNRPVIQMNRGKIQANIQHTVLAHTGDAIQVLSMLPFINRTAEGISVFGRGTPLIYIDNLRINNAAELNKLSSDEVKRVEIDLHPSASHGNDVKAVIKITTIRKGEGLSMNLTAQGTQVKHFSSLGLGKVNYRLKKWDFFADMGGQYGRTESLMENSLCFGHNGNPIDIRQSFNNNIRNKSFNVSAGLNFSNKGKNDFGMKYKYARTLLGKDELSGTSTYSEDNITRYSEEIMLLGNNEKTVNSLNTYYTTFWGKENRLAVNVDYIHGETLSQYESYQIREKDVDTKNKSDYHLYTGKAEVFNPLWGGKLNYGIELSYTDNIHSYHADQNTNTVLTESQDKNRQKLCGLFVSQSKTFGNFNVEVGGRMDFSDYQYFYNGERNKDVSKCYKNFLPFLQVDYDKNDVSITLSYRNSMHRPSYGQLNSSTVYVDKYTYQKGNPLLVSAYDYILDFMFSWKDFMVDATHTWYQNSLMRTTQKWEDGTAAVLFTTENIPHYREWSVTVSYSPTIKFWRPKAEISLFKQNLAYNGRDYNKPYFSYEFDNLFRLSKYINLSCNLWGTAAGNLYLLNFNPTFRTDIGLNAYLFKNKLAIWLKISDLFNTDKERWHSNMNGIYFAKDRNLDTRGVMLQLRYSFNPQRSKYKGRTTSSEITRF